MSRLSRWRKVMRKVVKKLLTKEAKKPAHHKSISCPDDTTACWGCCQGLVDVTQEEFDALAPLITDEALERTWKAMPIITMKAKTLVCPLLDPDTKKCTVYEERPMMCRGYMVASPLDDCYHDRVGDKEVAILKDSRQVATDYHKEDGSYELLGQKLLKLAIQRRTQ